MNSMNYLSIRFFFTQPMCHLLPNLFLTLKLHVTPYKSIRYKTIFIKYE